MLVRFSSFLIGSIWDAAAQQHAESECTGNYYRSRNAELLFNALASMVRLSWPADSRGLDLSAGKGNVGPLSSYVADRLSRRGFDSLHHHGCRSRSQQAILRLLISSSRLMKPSTGRWWLQSSPTGSIGWSIGTFTTRCDRMRPFR